MAVVERERDQSDQAGSGSLRPPAPGERAKRPSEERRAAAGRNALIGMVRARTSRRTAEQVQGLDRFAEAGEPDAEAARTPEEGDLPPAAGGPGASAEARGAPPDPAASGSSPARAGSAADREEPRGRGQDADARLGRAEAPPAEPADDAPAAAPALEAEALPEAVDPALAPALEALAAARAAAARVRGGAPVHAAVRPLRTSPEQPALEPWIPLSEALRLGGQRFRPLRQVIGPLPFATSDWRPRRPHLTVPPSAWIETPPRRRDLASDPDMPERGERFQRFRAQVEKAPPQVDEEAGTWTTNVPARIPPPLETPPSRWRRFLRLFRGADHPTPE